MTETLEQTVERVVREAEMIADSYGIPEERWASFANEWIAQYLAGQQQERERCAIAAKRFINIDAITAIILTMLMYQRMT